MPRLSSLASVLAGTATQGTDCTVGGGATGTITFAAGSATAAVAVDPTADTSVESDETVALTLAAGTGYTIGTSGSAVGTITNDDAATSPPSTPPEDDPHAPRAGHEGVSYFRRPFSAPRLPGGPPSRTPVPCVLPTQFQFTVHHGHKVALCAEKRGRGKNMRTPPIRYDPHSLPRCGAGRPRPPMPF